MQQLNEDQKKAIENQKKSIEKQIHRSAIFQRVSKGADGEEVLKELALQCGANSLLISNYEYDPIKLAYRAGRRDLWTFIQNCLNEDVEKAREMLKNVGSETTNP